MCPSARVMQEPIPQFMSVREVAEKLRRTPKTIRRWLNEGKLECCRIERKYVIPVEAVQKFLSRGKREQ